MQNINKENKQSGVYILGNKKRVNNMSREFINGVLIGSATTIFGFVLTMIWDYWKSNQQRKQLQSNLLTLLSDELEHNFSVIKNNKSVIIRE